MLVLLPLPQGLIALWNIWAGGPATGKGALVTETVSLALSLLLALLLPAPSWNWLMGGSLSALRQFCERVKQGDYRQPLLLRNENGEEDEWTALMRDFNWMARRMEQRERDLKKAVDELSRSRQLLREQFEAVEKSHLELKLAQGSLQSNHRNLENAYQKMKQMALTDPLTSLANRRCFFETMESQYGVSPDGCHPVSLLMLDIDRFKSINDQFGHQSGDRVLRQLAVLISGNTRQSDLTARIGGEEYAVLMPDTLSGAALQVARRIHTAVNEIRWQLGEDVFLEVTVSIGVCTLPCFRCRADGELLFHGADLALYHAKNNGRNGISRYDETGSSVEKIV